MIKRHPSLEQLIAYAEGSLGSSESLIIAAHCDMCEHCAEKVRKLTTEIAEHHFNEPEQASSSQMFSSMFESITQLPMSSQIVANPEPANIELDGRKFELPRALARYAHSTGNWSKLVGKLWQAPVEIGGEHKANFIFMEQGGSVPEHTHKGNELTLVINGEFSDGISQYGCGDFIAMNGAHTHAPFSDDKDGCLVFSIVSQPLHFTSGVARLLNPFSHLFF